MNEFTFLGLNGGFWFIGLPFGIFLIWIECRSSENENKYVDELTSRLPNEKLYLDISSEENFMLDNLSKRESLSSEKYIRSILKIATKEREDFEWINCSFKLVWWIKFWYANNDSYSFNGFDINYD